MKEESTSGYFEMRETYISRALTVLGLRLTSEERPFGVTRALEEALGTFFGTALTLTTILRKLVKLQRKG
jgi:hypothetical protein